ncbi:protein of unknown function [Maribacter sedimenticola]|uniref:DUF4304 domain-containing protein n=1 Tax=Maribacter sedimenticola TaxID=228956 RepID=A0ABY1SLD4_9FLAO|nr:DUF4304 domain-containing protein [Maribacter sedimenticola]SNR75242.1 protein of unknown function [Maribacter sedimenticola]
MKTNAELKFEEIIKTCFHEELKPLGFKKKSNNFYKGLSEFGHIINIQKTMFGSKDRISFTVNTGLFSNVFWKARFNFKNESNPPKYPTEPVCVVRKRIGQFLDGNDKWYEIEENTDTTKIKHELVHVLKTKILPFFSKVDNDFNLIDFLENEYKDYDVNLLKFIMYGEYRMISKLEKLYPEYIDQSPEVHKKGINKLAEKYGIKNKNGLQHRL